MKFFLDANLPYSAKNIFAEYGDVLHARDADLTAAADETIAQHARQEKAILVTQDLEFSNPYLFPPGAHVGLILVRMPNRFTAEQTKTVLQWFLEVTPPEEFMNAITIVEPGQIRRREFNA